MLKAIIRALNKKKFHTDEYDPIFQCPRDCCFTLMIILIEVRKSVLFYCVIWPCLEYV